MIVTYSNRAAARLAGVSHVAIAKAKQRGQLPADAGGKISRSDLKKWIAQRAARRAETCPLCQCKLPRTKSTPTPAPSYAAHRSVVARMIAQATASAAPAFIPPIYTEKSL